MMENKEAYPDMTIRNMISGKIVKVHATTDSADSSYGFLCWVDDDGHSYGQCQFGLPLGFERIN